MKTIVLYTMPVTTNRLYTISRYGKRILTKEARLNKEAIAKEAWALWNYVPRFGSVKVRIKLFFKTNRKQDLDNIKGLIDALSGILWQDDSQIVDLHILKDVDRENPRVEITL